MGCKVKCLKRGLGGSSGGRGRWERTEVLKADSKKLRRREDRVAADESRRAAPESLCEGCQARLHPWDNAHACPLCVGDFCDDCFDAKSGQCWGRRLYVPRR